MITGCGTLLPAFSIPSSIRSVRGCFAGARVSRSPRSCCGSRKSSANCSSSRAPKPGAAGGLPAGVAGRLGGAGDVDVRPRRVADELGEEQRGGDRPGVGAAEVAQVGDRRVELACGSGCSSGSCQTGSSVAVGRRPTWSTSAASLPITPATCVPSARMQAPVSVAMSTIASTPLLGGQHQRVGHHQPALGVGVDDLDGRAAADRDHVAERHGGARRHVVGAHQPRGDRRRAVERRGSADIAANTAAAPDMSFFIWAWTSSPA